MKSRKKSSAVYAALIYLTVTGFPFGMLKAAQTTRRLLYGGSPVMAQLTQAVPQDAEHPARCLELGGGEWKIQLPADDDSDSVLQTLPDKLPPGVLKALFRLYTLTDRLSDQTAEWISGAKLSSFCSR